LARPSQRRPTKVLQDSHDVLTSSGWDAIEHGHPAPQQPFGLISRSFGNHRFEQSLDDDDSQRGKAPGDPQRGHQYLLNEVQIATMAWNDASQVVADLPRRKLIYLADMLQSRNGLPPHIVR